MSKKQTNCEPTVPWSEGCLGRCIGMQTSMRVFVMVCKHLVCVFCLGMFKVGG